MRHSLSVSDKVPHLLIVSAKEPGVPNLDDLVFTRRYYELGIVTDLVDTVEHSFLMSVFHPHGDLVLEQIIYHQFGVPIAPEQLALPILLAGDDRWVRVVARGKG